VKQTPLTRWSIVYDLTTMRVHWRTEQNPVTRRLDLTAVGFACAPARAVPIDVGGGAMERGLAPYTIEDNLALARASFAMTSFLRKMPVAEVDRFGRWPERARCA
jgi:hypothetical protein